MTDNLVIRKKIQLKNKIVDPQSISEDQNNVVIRKKIQLKLKELTDDSLKKPPISLKKKSSIEQLNQYLDENFIHHLMYIKESWSEVKYKIRLDNSGQECWWDLEILLLHFAEQLNISCMSNPSPQWPSNPFNRQPFTKSQLLKLSTQIKELKIPVNYLIKELFNYLQTKFRYVPIEKFTACFIAYVNHNYRYKLINYLDSQDNYIGYWVKKNESFTLFERRYNEFKLVTPSVYNENTDQLVETPEHKFFKDILNCMPKETVDFSSIALESL